MWVCQLHIQSRLMYYITYTRHIVDSLKHLLHDEENKVKEKML